MGNDDINLETLLGMLNNDDMLGCYNINGLFGITEDELLHNQELQSRDEQKKDDEYEQLTF